MMAKNETGTIQQIAEMEKSSTRYVRIAINFLHTDAVQAVSRIPVNVSGTGRRPAIAVRHKIYAPKGLALFTFVAE